MANNSSSKYTFSSPQPKYDNGNTSYSYTISTTYTPQVIQFQSTGNNNNKNRPKASTPTLTSKGYTLHSPSRPKPISKHAKSASGILPHKTSSNKHSYASSFHNNIPENNKINTAQDLAPKDLAPHQRSVSSNLSMEYNPSSGSYGYSVTTTYSSIPTYMSEHATNSTNASTALGISEAPANTYVFVAPQPMRHTPSVAYLNNKSKPTNKISNNNSKSKGKIISKNGKKKYKPKSIISRSLPPTPTHPKKSRSFSNRNDIIQENKQYKNNNNNNNNKNSKLIIPSRISNSGSGSRSYDALDDDDDTPNNKPHTIIRSRTLNDDNMNINRNNNNKNNIGYRNKSTDTIISKSKSQNNSRAGSRTGSTHSSGSSSNNIENELENSFDMLEVNENILNNRSRTSHDDDYMGMSVKHQISRPRSSNFRIRNGNNGNEIPRHSNTFCVSKAPIIKQSKSYPDNDIGGGIEKEKESEKKNKNENENENDTKQQENENEDWQIMGDILFSLKHSLMCRMMSQSQSNSIEKDNNNKKKKNKKKKDKRNLSVLSNEWQTFYFEEYAQELFTELRAKWLNCNILSDKYLRKLFGCNSSTISCSELDINKACKFYWRRLNTNSKSGQIFFQTINGEYIIKSMPKSEAEFFRKSFLDKYYTYMLSSVDSLLMHIMGCYNIRYKKDKVTQSSMNLASNNEYNSKRKQDINKGVYVIVMKSILFCEMTPTVKMHKIYDLKGSKHNRTASRYKLELNKLTLDALTEIDEQSFEQDINKINNINDNIKLLSSSYSCGFYKPNEKEKEKNKFKKDKKNLEKGQINVYKRSKVLKDLDFMQDNEIINVGKK